MLQYFLDTLLSLDKPVLVLSVAVTSAPVSPWPAPSGNHDTGAYSADLGRTEPVACLIVQRLPEEGYHVDKDVVVDGAHLLKKAPRLHGHTLWANVRHPWQDLGVYHGRVQVGQERQQCLCHGVDTELSEFCPGVQALADIPHLLIQSREEEDVPLPNPLGVDGVNDAPQLLGYAESRRPGGGHPVGGMVFYALHGVERHGADGLRVGDELLETHAETGAGVVCTDRDVEVPPVLEAEDEDVIEYVLRAVERPRRRVVHGDGDLDGDLLSRQEHPESTIHRDPGFAQPRLLELGHEPVLRHHLSRVREAYGHRDPFVVPDLTVVQTRPVELYGRQRIVLHVVEHLEYPVVDLLPHAVVHVLDGDLEGGHDRLVV
mmetsp:Transcript_15895/g.31662  ORF Transcript_15895/g.31662 Transcript_15895/m.31662 type:complete len:374 (+) Transcript_15895:70-1191(+)